MEKRFYVEATKSEDFWQEGSRSWKVLDRQRKGYVWGRYETRAKAVRRAYVLNKRNGYVKSREWNADDHPCGTGYDD